jgi:hypothetical protein
MRNEVTSLHELGGDLRLMHGIRSKSGILFQQRLSSLGAEHCRKTEPLRNVHANIGASYTAHLGLLFAPVIRLRLTLSRIIPA